MTRNENIRNNLRRIGQLAGISSDETITAMRTRRQMLVTLVILVIGTMTLQVYTGTMPLKYTGISIHDFSRFWGMM